MTLESVLNKRITTTMDGKYDSVLMAKYIAAYLNDRKASVNITKVQKLLYIAYGTYLAIVGDRLVDEHPQAWPYGPVFPTTRNHLSKMNINLLDISNNIFSEISKDEDVKGMMNLIYNTFGNLTALSLSEWSHKKDSPWEKTTSKIGFKWGDQIDDEFIKEYFTEILIR